jgi:hypothetical protein|tara:strand:- start:394 stop:855 length:462 start_codon:yes stop_codon:yes gene_type:complete
MLNSDCSPNGVIYCQQNRTQELNERIFSRNNPYFKQPPRYNPVSLDTKRSKMPIVSSNNICNTNHKNGFNVDLETVLHNRHFALQNSELNEYVPSSTSSLYNHYIPASEPINNPHGLLNSDRELPTFNPNKYNIGKNIFNNSTRNQLLNIKNN